jgi:hypothetical protein
MLMLAVSAGLAHAQGSTIYKCIDANGRPLYTTEKSDTAGKKCEPVAAEVNVVPTQKPREAAARAAPRSYPRESAAQRSVAKEKKLLADARQALSEQEAVRSGSERNYARVLERLRPYQEQVELHQKNVEALERELANLYK